MADFKYSINLKIQNSTIAAHRYDRVRIISLTESLIDIFSITPDCLKALLSLP